MVKIRLESKLDCFLSTQRASKEIGIGYATLFRWIKSGKITPTYISRRTLISEAEAERLKVMMAQKNTSRKE